MKQWKTLGPPGLGMLVLLALLTGCTGIANAAGREAQPAQQGDGYGIVNSISVTGTGTANGIPDVAYITIGVSVIDPDVGQAVEANNTRMQAVKQALLDAGIDEKDLQTTGFSVWPEDIYDKQSGTPTGERTYHVDNMLNVKVRDMGRAGEMIDLALGAGANSVYGLSFGVDDTKALDSEARIKAIEDARAKAQEIADALGVKLGEAIMVSEGGAGSVIPYYPPMAADGAVASGAGAPPISPGELTVTQSLSIVFAIEK
jgi:uncharacterized protein